MVDLKRCMAGCHPACRTCAEPFGSGARGLDLWFLERLRNTQIRLRYVTGIRIYDATSRSDPDAQESLAYGTAVMGAALASRQPVARSWYRRASDAIEGSGGGRVAREQQSGRPDGLFRGDEWGITARFRETRISNRYQ